MDKRNYKTLMLMTLEYLIDTTIVFCIVSLIFFLRIGSMLNTLMVFLFIVALLGFCVVMSNEAYDEDGKYVDIIVMSGFILGIVACYFMTAFIAREFAGVFSIIADDTFVDALLSVIWSTISLSAGILSLMEWLET